MKRTRKINKYEDQKHGSLEFGVCGVNKDLNIRQKDNFRPFPCEEMKIKVC